METVFVKCVQMSLGTHTCYDGSCILHLLLNRGHALMTVLIIYIFIFFYLTLGICLAFKTLVSSAEGQTGITILTSLLCSEHL